MQSSIFYMDNSTKKFVEDQVEKLAHIVAKGFEQTATKDDITRLEENITRLEGKVDDGFGKLQQEHDEFRDRARPCNTGGSFGGSELNTAVMYA